MFMDITYFRTDNKSGYKTTESWFSKHHPEEYHLIQKHFDSLNLSDNGFKEKIWLFYNNLKERPKCLTCGKEIKFSNRFDRGYGDFCSLDCVNNNIPEMLTRIKKTNQKKFNVDFYPSHKDFIPKRKKTKLERYGNENYNNINKCQQTKMERYGDKNYNNLNKMQSTCLKKYDVDNFSKTQQFKIIMYESFYNKHNDKYTFDLSKNTKDTCTFLCKKHGYITTTKSLFRERIKYGSIPCTDCNPIGFSMTSTDHLNLVAKLKETSGLDIKENVKSLLTGKKEIDILINDKLGVEVNGIYWHSELFVDRYYHVNKTTQAKQNNIRLIHFFEDEIKFKIDIVNSIILNKLGLTKNKVYGRNCSICEVGKKDCSEFLTKNHIQGDCKGKFKYGLYHNNELISLMVFSKNRLGIGNIKQSNYELIRFCNKLNTNVVGGADKLLKHFIKTINPNHIISFADYRLFDGDVYQKLGFQFLHQTDPNYWYVIGLNRFHRFNYRKSILVKQGYDKDKTEKEIMFERKIYRVYDCGNLKFEWNKSN